MEEKINIAELLKDCPKGMELDCILYDNIYFDTVGHNTIKCYIQNKGYRTSITFDIYGGLIDSIPTKCVIFPKGKTTWEGFQRPWTIQEAKDGDVVCYDSGWTCIFKCIHGIWFSSYCFITDDGEFHTGYEEHAVDSTVNGNGSPATKEQRVRLFQKIKEAGYEWNAETKTLEKLVEPKFKVGDRIKNKNSGICDKVIKIFEDCYLVESFLDEQYTIGFDIQDNWELVPNKFDITTLNPFDKVLVRDYPYAEWRCDYYNYYDCSTKRYYTIGGYYKQCIPYNNETKHLVGIKKDCPECYKS